METLQYNISDLETTANVCIVYLSTTSHILIDITSECSLELLTSAFFSLQRDFLFESVP